MSGVVLRCPNCGTTRATQGECEACHEAQVRYYCTNHTPGRWLDDRACPQCKAAFGDPRRPAPRPSPPTPSPAPRTPAREARPARTPAPAPTPPRTAARVEPEAEPWGRSDGPPPRYEPESEEVDIREHPRDPRLVTWQDLLRAAMRARYSRIEAPAPEPERRRGLGPGGCLVRLVLMFFAFLTALYLFGGSLLQMFFFPF